MQRRTVDIGARERELALGNRGQIVRRDESRDIGQARERGQRALLAVQQHARDAPRERQRSPTGNATDQAERAGIHLAREQLDPPEGVALEHRNRPHAPAR